jgi:hypothetical protein
MLRCWLQVCKDFAVAVQHGMEELSEAVEDIKLMPPLDFLDLSKNAQYASAVPRATSAHSRDFRHVHNNIAYKQQQEPRITSHAPDTVLVNHLTIPLPCSVLICPNSNELQGMPVRTAAATVAQAQKIGKYQAPDAAAWATRAGWLGLLG